MTDGAAIFGDKPKNVICDDCGYPMALVRTDGDKIGALFRFECSNCSAKGTVEVRGKQSPAANAPLTKYHGAATDAGDSDD
jgi:hypothetical protein